VGLNACTVLLDQAGWFCWLASRWRRRSRRPTARV